HLPEGLETVLGHGAILDGSDHRGQTEARWPGGRAGDMKKAPDAWRCARGQKTLGGGLLERGREGQLRLAVRVLAVDHDRGVPERVPADVGVGEGDHARVAGD